jgi:hypothetical protein
MATNRSIQTPLPPMGLTSIDPPRGGRSTAVDHGLDLLRKAVGDCGYTLDALEAHMGKGRAYIHKVLSGEKPLSFEFITALPDDVEARFEQLRAESFGLIVVAPVQGSEAIKHFVGGLVGLLTRVA